MNDAQEWYDEDDQDFSSGGGNNLVKDLRNQLKAKAKAEKELTERLNSLQKQVREKSIGDVLKTSGVNEKVARLIPGDIEPTYEAVGAWLEEYKDVFGIRQETAPNEAPAPVEPDPDVVSQMTAMQQIAGSGQALGGPSQVTQADIDSAGSYEELMTLIARAKGA